MKYNSNPTSCEVFTSGEVEDYTIQIAATPNAGASVEPVEQTGFEFEVYPNPVSEVLHISMDNRPDAYEVFIQDMNGRLVMQSTDVDRLDVSQLQRGVYMVRITVNGEVVTRKFIKE
jgi:hypothetical protein